MTVNEVVLSTTQGDNLTLMTIWAKNNTSEFLDRFDHVPPVSQTTANRVCRITSLHNNQVSCEAGKWKLLYSRGRTLFLNSSCPGGCCSRTSKGEDGLVCWLIVNALENCFSSFFPIVCAAAVLNDLYLSKWGWCENFSPNLVASYYPQVVPPRDCVTKLSVPSPNQESSGVCKTDAGTWHLWRGTLEDHQIKVQRNILRLAGTRPGLGMFFLWDLGTGISLSVESNPLPRGRVDSKQ